MAQKIIISQIQDQRGCLHVLEREIPFPIKRVYFISDIQGERGGHRHEKTSQAIICLNGHCRIHVHAPSQQQIFQLDCKNECLLLDPQDWHRITDCSLGTILLVLASEYYDKDDYIYEKYD